MSKEEDYFSFTEKEIVTKCFAFGPPSNDIRKNFSAARYDILLKQENFTAEQKELISNSYLYFHEALKVVIAAIEIIQKNPASEYKQSLSGSEPLLDNFISRTEYLKTAEIRMKILYDKSFSPSPVAENSSDAYKALEAYESAMAKLEDAMQTPPRTQPTSDQISQLISGKITVEALQKEILVLIVEHLQSTVAAFKSLDDASKALNLHLDIPIEGDRIDVAKKLVGLKEMIQNLNQQEAATSIQDLLSDLEASVDSITLGDEAAAYHTSIAGGIPEDTTVT